MAANASTKSPHRTGKSLPFNKNREEEMRISPKDLTIVWGHDGRYWNVLDDRESVILNQVYWLEVTVSVANTDPNKKYQVGFHVSLTADAFGWAVPDASGWAGSPIYIMVKRGKEGKFEWKKCFLDQTRTDEFKIIRELSPPSENNDKQKKGDDDDKIYFGMYEVWSGKWKGGLKIHHAFVKELP